MKTNLNKVYYRNVYLSGDTFEEVLEDLRTLELKDSEAVEQVTICPYLDGDSPIYAAYVLVG
jgi:hypothetical protein